MNPQVNEVVFLRPTFVLQAEGQGLGVKVNAEAPRPVQSAAPGLVKLNVLS